MHVPEIKRQSRRDAEPDEIGERVEFRPEPRRSLEGAGQAAIETVEEGRRHDREDGFFERSFGREADGRQAQAERQERDEVGQDDPQRDMTEAATARRLVWSTGAAQEALARLGVVDHHDLSPTRWRADAALG